LASGAKAKKKDETIIQSKFETLESSDFPYYQPMVKGSRV